MLHITGYVTILLIMQEKFIVVQTQYDQPEYFEHDLKGHPELNAEYYMPKTTLRDISLLITTANKSITESPSPTFTFTDSTKKIVTVANLSDTTETLPTLPTIGISIHAQKETEVANDKIGFNRANLPKSSQSSIITVTMPTTELTSTTVSTPNTITAPTVTIPLRSNINVTTSATPTTTLATPTTTLATPTTTLATPTTTLATPTTTLATSTTTLATSTTTLATPTTTVATPTTTLATTTTTLATETTTLATTPKLVETTTKFVPTAQQTTDHSELEYAHPIETSTAPTTAVYEEVIEYEELTTDPFSKNLENMFKIFAKMKVNHYAKFNNAFYRRLKAKITAGSFHAFGPVISTYIEDVHTRLEFPTDELQRMLAMGYHQMRTRRKSLAADLNSMLDYIDMLYDVSEEKKMHYIINDTLMYPNISKTPDEIVESLVLDVFVQPMKRVSGTSKGNVLFATMTKIIVDRHPEYSRDRRFSENKQVDILNRQIESIREAAKHYRMKDRRFKFAKEDDGERSSENYLYTHKYRIKVTESKKRKHSRRDKHNNDESTIANKKRSFKNFDEKDLKHIFLYSHGKRKPDAYLNDVYGVATTVKRKKESLTTLANNYIKFENKRRNVMSDADSIKDSKENKTIRVSDKDTERKMRGKLDNVLGGNIYYNKNNLDRYRKGRHKEFGGDRRTTDTQFNVKISSTLKPTKQLGFASERMKSFRNKNYDIEFTQYSREPSSNTNNYVEQKIENSQKAVSITKRFHSYKPKVVYTSNKTSQFSVQTLPDTTPFKFFRLNPETHQDNNDKINNKHNNKLESVISEFGEIPNIIDFSMKVHLKNPMKRPRHKGIESGLMEKGNKVNIRDRQATYEQRTLNPYKMDQYFVRKVTRDPGVWYISEKPPPNNVDDVPYEIYAVSVEAGRDQNMYNKMKDKRQSHNRKHEKKHLRKHHKRKRDKLKKRHKHRKHSNKKHKSKHHHAHLKKKKHERKRFLHRNLRTHNNKRIVEKSFERPLVKNEEKKKRYNVIVTPKATHMEVGQMENNANVLKNRARARAVKRAKAKENVNVFTNDNENVFKDYAYSAKEHKGNEYEHDISSELSSCDKENAFVKPQLIEEKDYVISEQDTSEYRIQIKMEKFPKNISNEKGTKKKERQLEKTKYLKNTHKPIRIQSPKHENNGYLTKGKQKHKITPHTKVNKDSVISERHSVNHFKNTKNVKNKDDVFAANSERSNKHKEAYYNSEDDPAKRIQKKKNTPYTTKVIKNSIHQDNAMSYSKNKKMYKNRNTYSANGEQANVKNNHYHNDKNRTKRIRKNKITIYRTNTAKDIVKSDRDNVVNNYKTNNKNNNDDLDSAISEQNHKYKDSADSQSEWIQKHKSKHHKTKAVKDFSNSDEYNSVEGYGEMNIVHDHIDSANKEYISNGKETNPSNEDFRRNKKHRKGIVNLMQDSEYSDDEKELKKNLYDAFRHDDGIDYRKRMRHEIPLIIGLREEPVYTDDEAVLKRRIYEVINGTKE